MPLIGDTSGSSPEFKDFWRQTSVLLQIGMALQMPEMTTKIDMCLWADCLIRKEDHQMFEKERFDGIDFIRRTVSEMWPSDFGAQRACQTDD